MLSPLISQGRWALLFVGVAVDCPEGNATLTPLSLHLFERACSQVFSLQL